MKKLNARQGLPKEQAAETLYHAYRKMPLVNEGPGKPFKKVEGPKLCWFCGEELSNDNVQPFFCKVACGYEWALMNAIQLQKLKEKHS